MKLAKIKETAGSQQAKSKTSILTKTAQAQLADRQSLVDRYLEDDPFRAYADALDRARAERTQKPQAR